MDILIIILLCLIGIVLILVEIFLIPGITVVAIAGAAFLAGGVYYAFSNIGAEAGVITIVTSLLFGGIGFLYLIKSNLLDKSIALKTNIDSTVASEDSLHVAVGDTGVTISRLNPVGKVKVNGIIMEAKTISDFIDEETEIEVLKVTRTQLIVKQKNEQ